MKKNENKILEVCSKYGYCIGCYDLELEKLNYQNLKKVLDNIKYQDDVKVFINRKPYIVQIDEVEGEIDFNVITLAQYQDMFGEWEE